MKIVIATDSFKGSLSAREACHTIEKGILRAFPSAVVQKINVSDGGEGLLDVFKGKIHEVDVLDPLNRQIKSKYLILNDNQTALIEMSQASGLLLLSEKERNPLYTTTYGTGQLIKHALDAGYKKLILGIGGSATNDCGTGMAQALGVRFLRKNTSEIKEKMCGNLLSEVDRIDMNTIHPAVNKVNILVACDVKNPLIGEHGAAKVYAKQKGASDKIIKQLESNMKHFVRMAEKQLNKSVDKVEGAGAAGGLGAGTMLFLNGKLTSGVYLILEKINFSDVIKDADLIITGEGKIDNQTGFNKVISGIATRAKKHHIPVIAFAGQVEQNLDYKNPEITYIELHDKKKTLEYSMKNAADLLEEAVYKTFINYRLQ